MDLLIRTHYFRLMDRQLRINYCNRFDPAAADATARIQYNLTMHQLQLLTTKFRLPSPHIQTKTGDVIPTVEALVMICRRLAEPLKLFTVANEFGRSPTLYNRVCTHVTNHLYKQQKNLLYFNRAVVAALIEAYCTAIASKEVPLKSCWAFIDGTKQYIAHSSARKHPTSAFENLQRAICNGHPRRHCIKLQAVTTPDGITASVYSLVGGRHHDTTMLSMSGFLSSDEEEVFEGRVKYGNPAYGCSKFVCCPFGNRASDPMKSAVNARMNAVRESVEWDFGQIKVLWLFVKWDKKMRTRQAPVGKIFFTSVLQTNVHTCLQAHGDQISIYFDLSPPTL